MYNKILTITSVLTTIATFFVYANVAKAQFVTEGLVSYWSFEAETIEGKTVRDVWEKNDGTIVGDPKKKLGKSVMHWSLMAMVILLIVETMRV